ncbi:hypothetical protein DE146DRAFT_653704 [Phaeosphaeria sp. MPI-PUGE-AT-0046c]|nr:hypothetical protein DE146DRAFT_653704 [Phaeosphaeria sp. MPI-PUGE-AT-0046c]
MKTGRAAFTAASLALSCCFDIFKAVVDCCAWWVMGEERKRVCCYTVICARANFPTVKAERQTNVHDDQNKHW